MESDRKLTSVCRDLDTAFSLDLELRSKICKILGSLSNYVLNFKLIAEKAAKIELITEIHLPYQDTVLRLIGLPLLNN